MKKIILLTIVGFFFFCSCAFKPDPYLVRLQQWGEEIKKQKNMYQAKNEAFADDFINWLKEYEAFHAKLTNFWKEIPGDDKELIDITGMPRKYPPEELISRSKGRLAEILYFHAEREFLAEVLSDEQFIEVLDMAEMEIKLIQGKDQLALKVAEINLLANAINQEQANFKQAVELAIKLYQIKQMDSLISAIQWNKYFQPYIYPQFHPSYPKFYFYDQQGGIHYLYPMR